MSVKTCDLTYLQFIALQMVFENDLDFDQGYISCE